MVQFLIILFIALLMIFISIIFIEIILPISFSFLIYIALGVFISIAVWLTLFMISELRDNNYQKEVDEDKHL